MTRIVLTLARVMAVLGGIVLSLLVAMVVVSIFGRELGAALHGDFAQAHLKGFADWALGLRFPGLWGTVKLGPVTGDFELVEAGMAFAIFAFLPLTQITGGHAVVDVFTAWLPSRVQRALVLVSEILFAVVLTIIALKLAEGMLAKQARGQTTFLLQMPLWWAYAASLVGAVLAALTAIYVALARVYEIVTGRETLPHSVGEEA